MYHTKRMQSTPDPLHNPDRKKPRAIAPSSDNSNVTAQNLVDLLSTSSSSTNPEVQTKTKDRSSQTFTKTSYTSLADRISSSIINKD
ncbi:hypothetical protein PTTG_28297 [Puccinia triticina 1-1 BBBD Race 1]|uniref:Uncharacterized protein n=1 Tax=Puccinia triticina (isolate 1-1 / race 1 (BBBD)) TaxID=630390 RepID=A0A180GDH1_PUCT1|nr:hypothetical protein PTTG_28297 [Puccinia triticina 1-1 BBBD Race 1]